MGYKLPSLPTSALHPSGRVEPTAPYVNVNLASVSPGLLDIARFWTKRRVVLLVVTVDEVTVWVRTFTAIGVPFDSG